MVNLLISELVPMDVVLDRAIPWMDDLESYLSTLPTEPEALEDHEQPAPGRWTAWCEPRLSALRQLIAGC